MKNVMDDDDDIDQDGMGMMDDHDESDQSVIYV